MILITSANGKSGRHLIPQLVKRGRQVRALDISPSAETLREIGAAEVIVGDMDDPNVLARAVDGVEAVVHVGPPMHPRETAMGQAAVAAAERAGVARFVLYSVIHPQLSALVNHHAKLGIEDRLLTADVRPTILRPQHYMQNIAPKRCVEAGYVALPYSAHQRLAFVDMADVAEIAADVLCEDGHDYATYDLCGSDYLSTTDVAALISRASGTHVDAVEWTTEEFIQKVLGAGEQPAYTIDALHRLFAHYARHGINGNPNVLSWLLGRPPTTFEEYVKRELSRS